jgi:hypothetical protein
MGFLWEHSVTGSRGVRNPTLQPQPIYAPSTTIQELWRRPTTNRPPRKVRGTSSTGLLGRPTRRKQTLIDRGPEAVGDPIRTKRKYEWHRRPRRCCRPGRQEVYLFAGSAGPPAGTPVPPPVPNSMFLSPQRGCGPSGRTWPTAGIADRFAAAFVVRNCFAAPADRQACSGDSALPGTRNSCRVWLEPTANRECRLRWVDSGARSWRVCRRWRRR